MEMNHGETKGLSSWLWKCYDSSKVAVGMVLVQVFLTGMSLLSHIILSNGIFVFALMTYRHVIATICIAPLALILEREKKKENKVTLKIWFWVFMNALMGNTGGIGLYYYGLVYTTATYAVNFLNLIPIVTFVLSVIVGMESLGLHRWSGRFKVIGVCLCVGGALTTSLYNGKEFYIQNAGRNHHSQHVAKGMKNLPKGSIFLTVSCLCYGAWSIVQAKLLKIFPLKYWATMLTCVMATVQSAVIGFCMNRNKSAWKLGFNLPLLTIVYSGALATAATFCLISYAIQNRGPTYPSMFGPLTLIFVALLEALILGEPIKLGAVLGTVVIIAGLYSYLLGKQNELINKAPIENDQLRPPDIEVAIINPAVTASTVVVTAVNSGNGDDGQDNMNESSKR